MKVKLNINLFERMTQLLLKVFHLFFRFLINESFQLSRDLNENSP